MIFAKYQHKVEETQTVTELYQLLDLAMTDRELIRGEYFKILVAVSARLEQLTKPTEVAA